MTGCVEPKGTLRAQDARADGAQREIFLARENVLIRRRVSGIEMRLDVPSRAYRGVLLWLEEAADGEPSWRVGLLHRDPDLSVLLQEADNDRDIVADWISWARWFGLPKLVERTLGQIECADESCGAVLLGRGFKLRRRGATMTKRRPRILALRKRGDQARLSNRFADERVIVSYE